VPGVDSGNNSSSGIAAVDANSSQISGNNSVTSSPHHLNQQPSTSGLQNNGSPYRQPYISSCSPRRSALSSRACTSSSSHNHNNNGSSPRNLAALVTDDQLVRPARLDVLLAMPIPDRETQEAHSWNPDDRSLNIFVKDDDKMTFHRHPVAQSTDCIRGRYGFSRGFHVWQITWASRQRGTHAVVGVATSAAALHHVGYTSLVGANNDGWGWDIGRNKFQLYHNTRTDPPISYPSSMPADGSYSVPDSFMVVLDMDEGTMAYCADGKYLGVAFRGLKGKTVYPIVSAVWGHCEITMKYMGGLDPEPLALMDMCRKTIRGQMGKTRLRRYEELNLPQALKNYLLYQ
jgi:SPRY domain-containing SOCS box protein 1/4